MGDTGLCCTWMSPESQIWTGSAMRGRNQRERTVRRGLKPGRMAVTLLVLMVQYRLRNRPYCEHQRFSQQASPLLLQHRGRLDQEPSVERVLTTVPANIKQGSTPSPDLSGSNPRKTIWTTSLNKVWNVRCGSVDSTDTHSTARGASIEHRASTWRGAIHVKDPRGGACYVPHQRGDDGRDLTKFLHGTERGPERVVSASRERQGQRAGSVGDE